MLKRRESAIEKHIHPASGNPIVGKLLSPGDTVRPDDKYADFCGGWLSPPPNEQWSKIKMGCTTLFVRPG